jgi:AraC-like DNA-binding protein
MRPLIFALFVSIFQLASAQTQLDSLSAILKNHPENDTVKVNLLNELSYQYRWIDFANSQQYAEQALAIAQLLNYNKGIAVANYRIGHCYWALGDNELAIEKGMETVAIAERENFKSILAEGFQIIARGYMDQRETKKAEENILKAEKIALQIKNWDLLSRVYNLAGVIQFVKRDKDTALQLYTKALSIVEEHPTSKAHLSQITSNIGECYLEKNPDMAFTYFKSALLISTSPKSRNKSAEAAISSIMGHALIRTGSYKEAEYYLRKSLRLSRALGLKRSIRHAYSGLVNLKIREGKSTEALDYFKKYYDVHDSILNVAKTRQIVEMETRYELEKKEQNIKLLQQETEIREMQRNLLIVGFILFGALSVLLYYLQEYREKKNRQILNLEIDNLTNQHKEVSEKYKNALAISVPVDSVEQRLFKKAIEVVENNLSNPLFGVEQMAKELGMSRTSMHRKIKTITGFPPSELIRNIRLRKAAHLLLHQADSVSQIGFKVGFEDHSYFSKSFKKQFGVTPSEYLQSQEQQN